MMRRDVQATDAKAYKDNRSHITLDGREILHGEDWKARKKELWVRCGGKCESFMRCTAEAMDPHHVIFRSKRRNDALENLLALCRYHHNLMDKRKPIWSKRESLVKR